MQHKKLQTTRHIIQGVFFALLLAGLYMNLRMALIVFLPGALFFGNFFCGWICPFGALQEVCGMLGSKIVKKKFTMPWALQKYLRFVRYGIFILFVAGIASTILASINGYGTFFNTIAQGFILSSSTVIMISLLVIALFFERPFCNYLCTEGVKYGILSFLRIFTIKRNPETCVHCKKCDNACPMHLVISDKTQIRNAQCINCFQCISACPVDTTLSYGFTKIQWKTREKQVQKEK